MPMVGKKKFPYTAKGKAKAKAAAKRTGRKVKKAREATKVPKKKKANDACAKKVKARYKVWPSAYASGAVAKCRKVGAKNWGKKSGRKKK